MSRFSRRFSRHQRSKVYWTYLILPLVACLVDSGFTHGYLLYAFKNMPDAVNEWLHSIDIKTNTTNSMKNYSVKFKISYFQLTESFHALGGVIGSCFTAYVATKFGRRGGMLVTAFISIVASLFGGYSKFFGIPFFLGVSHLLYGVRHGINSGLAPMYLVEISPPDRRGQIGMLYGIAVSIGTYIGYKAAVFFGNRVHWPMVMSLPVLATIIQIMLLPQCPESPKYLYVIKGNEGKCRKAFKWLRGDSYNEEEIDNLRIEYNQRRVIGDIKLGLILKNSILRNALIASTLLMASQQLCGISMFLYFVQTHLLKSGSVKTSFRLKHIKHIFFAIKNSTAIIAFFFITDKYSRRKSYLVCFSGMAASSCIMCILFTLPNFYFKEDFIHLLATCYLVFYKIGTGVLSWFTASEFFNTSAAPIGYGFGTGSAWLVMFGVKAFVIPLYGLLKDFSFVNYILINAGIAYFVYFKVPETKNKSIKEVYRSIYMNNNKQKTNL